MSARYTVKVTNYFCGAHRLRNYQGICEQEVHGHNYQLTTAFTATELDDCGMVIDFTVARPIIDEVIKQVDHKYFNDVPPFDVLNPTAENLAAWLYKTLSARLNSARVRIAAVTLQETAHDAVHYTEE
jgi:6-pyruvoyltetrahydropterin/6-carboxytetrahydropterin synthase